MSEQFTIIEYALIILLLINSITLLINNTDLGYISL